MTQIDYQRANHKQAGHYLLGYQTCPNFALGGPQLIGKPDMLHGVSSTNQTNSTGTTGANPTIAAFPEEVVQDRVSGCSPLGDRPNYFKNFYLVRRLRQHEVNVTLSWGEGPRFLGG